MPRVALYLNPFDPPTIHHRRIAERLCAEFDRVVIVPSGPRKLGPIPESRSIHRATLSDINFRGLPKLTVDLDDLEHNRFQSPADLAARCAKPGEDVWHVVSSEWVRGGGSGKSVIHREWTRGYDLWKSDGFVVLRENNEPLEEADLPPRSQVLTHAAHIPSGTVRMILAQGEEVNGALYPPVETYIRRHGLFRDVHLGEKVSFRVAAPKFKLFVDESNELSRDYAARLKPYESPEPEMIVALGGDGTMLRAIRKHWRDRLPFIGINTGGLGFLLSGRELINFWERDLTLYALPLLRVETESVNGEKSESVAFNDAWVERATGQTAWVRVLVNGVERVPRLVGDGVLVTTAAGSNSYARAMGATPVPLNTEVLMLVGSNVLKPIFWKPVVLPLDAQIVFESLDTVRRPLRGNIDGEACPDPLRRMTIRASRTAAVEIAFTPEHDPVAKLGFVQFPKENE